MSTLILDGYNVIHAIAPLRDEAKKGLAAARAKLKSLCSHYLSGQKGARGVYIFYDGRGPCTTIGSRPREGVTEVFSGGHQEADESIAGFIHRLESPASCTVVSNDNHVCNNARSLGALSMSVREFEARLLPGRTSTASPSRRGPAAEEKDVLTEKQKREITEEYRRRLMG